MVRSSGEWHKQLSAEQYYVTRQQGTDVAFSGTYYQIHQDGLFRCICCDNAVFSSDTKFDSGTGWPSFWAPIAEENVRTRSDFSLLVKRTEVHCTRCDAHLGHVFNDGPEPTNLRYCINESSLRVHPARSVMVYDLMSPEGGVNPCECYSRQPSPWKPAMPPQPTGLLVQPFRKSWPS